MQQHSARAIRKYHRDHARNRALERFGLELQADHLEWLASRIAANDPECILLERLTIKRTCYAILIGDVWAPVVYDSRRRCIVTFLPREVLSVNGLQTCLAGPDDGSGVLAAQAS